MKPVRSHLILIAVLPLLGGCINDGASLKVHGALHSLSLTRAQPWFWDKKVELHMVVQRMPDCQRRHHLQPATVSTATAEIYAAGEGTYLLKQGPHLYLFETVTCEGFQELKEPPPGGLGEKLGVFREENGAFRFIPEPVKRAPAAETSP
jgi:hypothetical protein